MDSRTGKIAEFKNESEAKAAGYDLKLSNSLAGELQKLELNERLPYLLWLEVQDRLILGKVAETWFKKGVAAAVETLNKK